RRNFMAVTLKDVAEACGVSYSTVSKALKNSHLVKPKTKNLIQQKALEMNYIPNHSARALVSKKSGTIGLIWPSVDRVAVTHLISEINHAIKDLGYVMFVSIDDVAAASKKFVEFGCDGIVIFDEGDATNLSPEIYNNVAWVAYGGNRVITYLYHFIEILHFSYLIIDSTCFSAIVTYSSFKYFLQYNDLAQGVICSSYDITVGTINALGPNDHPILYSYDNIPQIKKLDYPVN